MNFAKDIEMPEASREKVNAALTKQRNKIAFLEMQLERAFNAGFSLGFGSESMNNLAGQFEKFRSTVMVKK